MVSVKTETCHKGRILQHDDDDDDDDDIKTVCLTCLLELHEVCSEDKEIISSQNIGKAFPQKVITSKHKTRAQNTAKLLAIESC